MIPGGTPAGLAADESFRAGVRRLGERGLTYDSWHFHYQNAEFASLAAACPETVFVLDHFGTPLGVGRWAGRREEVFEEWAPGISPRGIRCANGIEAPTAADIATRPLPLRKPRRVTGSVRRPQTAMSAATGSSRYSE